MGMFVEIVALEH